MSNSLKVVIYCILLLFCLSSCVSKTVHIHSGSLSLEQVEQLEAALALKGFKYRIRKNKHPSPELGNTLIHHTHRGYNDDVNDILFIVESENLTIDKIIANQFYNHEYTKGNFGLYFKDDSLGVYHSNDVAISAEMKISDFEFASADCQNQPVLELNTDSSVRIAFVQTPEEISTGLSWNFSSEEQDFMAIKTKSQLFQYRILQFSKTDALSTRYTMVLKPLESYRLPYGCEYMGIFTLSR